MAKSALDFLRLATWDIIGHTDTLSETLLAEPGEWEPGKWLQYHGWRKDGQFIGTGEQNGKRHSIVNISGYQADAKYRPFLSFESYYATRVDIQVTLPKPASVDLADIYRTWQNKKSKISLIQSEKNDTLYIGARTSDVFIRLYEKPLDQLYLRLEFEFKGKAARAIWRSLQAKSTKDEIFQHYLARSPLPEKIIKLYFEAQDGDTQFAIREEIAKSDSDKLAWLQSIDASVRQAIYNHNIGSQVQELVCSWANEASNVDRLNEND